MTTALFFISKKPEFSSKFSVSGANATLNKEGRQRFIYVYLSFKYFVSKRMMSLISEDSS